MKSFIIDSINIITEIYLLIYVLDVEINSIFFLSLFLNIFDIYSLVSFVDHSDKKLFFRSSKATKRVLAYKTSCSHVTIVQVLFNFQIFMSRYSDTCDAFKLLLKNQKKNIYILFICVLKMGRFVL